MGTGWPSVRESASGARESSLFTKSDRKQKIREGLGAHGVSE